MTIAERLADTRQQCEYNCPDDPPWGKIEQTFDDLDELLGLARELAQALAVGCSANQHDALVARAKAAGLLED